jgi:hypothetical protein
MANRQPALDGIYDRGPSPNSVTEAHKVPYAPLPAGVRMLVQFAATLESYQEGILAYYEYRISMGPLEGTNTKIHAMKRQPYGFRDRAFFNLKILGIHETKRALVE